ncbi:hypothetical protein [Streptomyces sp. NPDC008001]|uniref:hypothetical protein n=1 Tax=Streptomyces sp. NPDC008001 TaxID=3364804 RepID=UPI0036EA43A5
MRVRKLGAALATTGTLAALGLGALSAPASAAESAKARPSCKVTWSDDRTAGIKCTGGGSFEARALCTNGKWAYTATTYAGTTAYAYCSSYGSYLVKKPQIYWKAWGV